MLDVASPDIDNPGAMSIVVQGALFQGNLIETANHLGHWRELFPQAEIILAISVTDVIMGSRQNGVLDDIRLVAKHRQDGHLQSALTMIMAAANKIGVADAALPLPPIKSDSPKLNNANLQIEAARCGLRLATGRYVLRVRSDLIFLTRGFLSQWEAAAAMPRGPAATFRERVLISWLYTLNPFTVERMPLHFSDWFHFGRLEDVRRIWEVPCIRLRDSIHYRMHLHDPGSNDAERLFNTRLGVEQHILYHAFKGCFPQLTLDYHNDLTSIDLSMEILVDNFALCDLVAASCAFDKYDHDFREPSKTFHCITPQDWQALALARDVDARTTLSDKIALAGTSPGAVRRGLVDKAFTAAELRTRIGRLQDGAITATAPSGVLVFGPYTTLPSGRYVATLDATVLDGPGTVTLKVAVDAGNTVLAHKVVRIGLGAPPVLDIEFAVPEPNATRLEVVCAIKGLQAAAVGALRIQERAAVAPGRRRSVAALARSLFLS